jgi:hypothetical protein
MGEIRLQNRDGWTFDGRLSKIVTSSTLCPVRIGRGRGRGAARSEEEDGLDGNELPAAGLAGLA